MAGWAAVVPGRRGGAARRSTLSERIRARTCTGKVGQEKRQAGRVVAGIGHDQHVRVAGLPLPGRDQPAHDVTHLPGGDRRGVSTGRQPHRVQRRSPRTAAASRATTIKYGQPGTMIVWSLPRP